MARCPDCNKFVSFEEEEPEINVDVDDEGAITGTCRIVNSCQDCGAELTEYTFDIETAVELPEEVLKKVENGASISVGDDAERGSRIEGRGRGTKTFYGARATFTVTVEGVEQNFSVEWNDDVQASFMDTLT